MVTLQILLELLNARKNRVLLIAQAAMCALPPHLLLLMALKSTISPQISRHCWSF